MENKKKKRVKKYISWCLIAAVVVILAAMPLLTGGNEETGGPQASILTGTAQRGQITTQLLGGGTLTADAAVQIEIPAAVKLTGYTVGNGDTVEAGDTIATVDRVTVMTAISQVQETLEYLAEQIAETADEKAPDTVDAQAGGTVKHIYAQEGQSVQAVMLEYGALAVLSLDDKMSVQLTCRTDLRPGDPVTITLADGTQCEGKTESNLEDLLVVVFDDNGYAVGEEVTVSADGVRVGSGTMQIHSQWNAIAYSGVISDIHVQEGDSISAGKTLFELDDTGHTAQYQKLVSQHREYEALMLELFKMYQTQTVIAPTAGVITGVDEAGAYMLADNGAGYGITLLANAPNGDDETGYANYIGQVTAVGPEGWSLRIDPQPRQITDYKELSGLSADPGQMTQDAVFSASVPVYQLSGGEWVQIGASAVGAGDVLLFASDASGNFVWVVRLYQGSIEPEEPSDPTEPTDPELPTDPDMPTDPDVPTDPSTPSIPGGSYPQGGGSYFGFGAVTQPEEEYELYGLETVTVASVTSQEILHVEISVDELDISKVFVGQTADVTLDALTGEHFSATVTNIAGTGENEGGNSKFTVELTLQKSGDILPGMNASVFIPLEVVEDAICVPVAALTEEANRTVLYTAYDPESGQLSAPVAVTVGASDGENVQILFGLEEGRTYFYPYYDTLVVSDAPQMGGFPFGR